MQRKRLEIGCCKLVPWVTATSSTFGVSFVLNGPASWMTNEPAPQTTHVQLDCDNLDEPLNRWLRWGLPSLDALRCGCPVGLAAASEGRPLVDQLAMVNVAH
jgi:hypothetical protein